MYSASAWREIVNWFMPMMPRKKVFTGALTVTSSFRALYGSLIGDTLTAFAPFT